MAMNENWLSEIKQAACQARQLTTEQKNQVLETVAQIMEDGRAPLLEANKLDCAIAYEKAIDDGMLDRLKLTNERISSMITAIKQVIDLVDPVGKIESEFSRDDHLKVTKVRVPIGVIMMIYESRPNVTIDAAMLCFKTGNAVILRGGSESLNTNRCLLSFWQLALKKHGLPEHCISMVPEQSHQLIMALLKRDDVIDLVIPRGGERLIRTVVEHSQIPVLKHYKGVCHCYVDQSADIEKALAILFDGKLSRPSVCNALEAVLIHKGISEIFWARFNQIALDNKLSLKACEKSHKRLSCSTPADSEDYGREFLSKTLLVKEVENSNSAIKYIQQYGTQHTEVVVAENKDVIDDFVRSVDASVTMVNCSSRFSDGGELGLGAEIGISTSKLHCYGPMGMESLTIVKTLVFGSGHIRHPVSSYTPYSFT